MGERSSPFTIYHLLFTVFYLPAISETEPDAGRELKIVPGRAGDRERHGHERVAGSQQEGVHGRIPVADDGVACVEAQEDAARGVNFEDAAEVRGEVRQPPRPEAERLRG